MDPEFGRILATPRQKRIFEERSPALKSFLQQHGLPPPGNVQYAPYPGAGLKRCFLNVEDVVQRLGGRMETGWLFVEYVGISIFTEAHAVWMRPDGKRRDVTPQQPAPHRRVMFLPDPSVREKRGYTRPLKTLLTSDPKLIALETFESEYARMTAEHFVRIGEEIVIPTEKLLAAARAAQLPEDVARYVVGVDRHA